MLAIKGICVNLEMEGTEAGHLQLVDVVLPVAFVCPHAVL